ncbi:MAG: tRNA (adenosine(37)-N6)-threonylcarbamoyltransferase complex ATPase subunit type 1 TsaE [Gammaproteobacteria bacterium]
MRIHNAGEMEELGRQLAAAGPAGIRIHLQGELGAGKTTLVRGYLRGCGYRGNVKSPTYTLVEPYLIEDKRVYHFDLYRIGEPEELEAIGLRDYLDGKSRILVEWPERAADLLPQPDLLLVIDIDGGERDLALRPLTEVGRRLLAALEPVHVQQE